MTTDKKIIEEIEKAKINYEFKRHEEFRFILRFIDSIDKNLFDKKFLYLMFSNSRIDLKIASRDIIRFIEMNKYKWELPNNDN